MLLKDKNYKRYKNDKYKLNLKRGNAIIFIFILFMIFFAIVFSIIMLYFQICIKPQWIEEDLKFAIKNEAIINADKDLLKLQAYQFDLKKIKEEIEERLNQKYENISVESIEYDDSSNYFIVVLNYKIKPMILFNDKEKVVKINKNIKFKLLEEREN